MARLPLLLCIASLAACAASSVLTSPHALHGTWDVVAIEGAPVNAPLGGDEADRPSLSFQPDGRLFGRTGVNGITGTWKLEDGNLAVPMPATTRRGGPPHLMDQEARMLACLDRVTVATRGAGQVVLRDGDGTALLRLSPR